MSEHVVAIQVPKRTKCASCAVDPNMKENDQKLVCSLASLVRLNHVERPSERASTFEPWLLNMASSSKWCTMQQKLMHSAAKWLPADASAAPVVAPKLTSELLHCLFTLPDPWPLAKLE